MEVMSDWMSGWREGLKGTKGRRGIVFREL